MAQYKDYKKGQKLIYFEDNTKYRVKVLEVKGDRKYESYDLEVLEIIEQHFMVPVVPAIKAGEKFNCKRLRGLFCFGIWDLEEIVEKL